MSTDALDHKKAGDVARVTLAVRKVVPCGICAMGIACDIVERYWHGGDGVDWKANGHVCRMTEKGLTQVEIGAVSKIEAEFSGKEKVTA